MEKIDAICEYLNQMLKADSEAVELLFNYRVECNKELGSVCLVDLKDEQYNVSLIGVINSMLTDALNIDARIAIVVDSDTREIVKFQRWTGNTLSM